MARTHLTEYIAVKDEITLPPSCFHYGVTRPQVPAAARSTSVFMGVLRVLGILRVLG